jgi:hypothetical protein
VGHVVFMPFGQFVMIAGGSLFQVIVPAVFAGYFFYNRQPFSGALVLFWVVESLLNVSVYAGDAAVQQLPLLGGQDSIHDWNYLLEDKGLLGSTHQIAGAIRLAGTAVIVTGLVLAILQSISRKIRRERIAGCWLLATLKVWLQVVRTI